MDDYQSLGEGYSIYNILKRNRFMNESTGESVLYHPSNYQIDGKIKDESGYEYDYSHYHDDHNRGACYLNADCPHGELCIPVKLKTRNGIKFSKKCVDRCDSNMDCPYSEVCYGGYCVQNPDDPDTINPDVFKIECAADGDCIQLSDDVNFSRCLPTANGNFCSNVPFGNVPEIGAQLISNVVLDNRNFRRLY